jgi:hypothetical protein
VAKAIRPTVSKPASALRLGTVKVSLNVTEMTLLDELRGHYERSAFMRAAALNQPLPKKPDPLAVTTWAESARIQACFTQLNELAHPLNTIRLEQGEEAAARELLRQAPLILSLFKKFRSEILGGEQDE